SLYYYTHCEAKLTTADPTKTYTEEILPMKLAIDRVYLEEATVWYDLRIIIRTVVIVAARAVGWTRFSDPPELANVRSSPELTPTTCRDRASAGEYTVPQSRMMLRSCGLATGGG